MKKIYSKNTPKPSRTIEDDFFIIGCILAAVLAAAAGVSFLRPGLWPKLNMPPCIFHAFTGYYCPGCGGTRAVKALLQCRFVRSVYYHPFVPYAAVIYTCFMVSQTAERISRGKLSIGMHYHNYYIWIALILILGNFILKNILHHFYGFLL